LQTKYYFVTSTSRKPRFVTDANNRTIGRFKVKLPYCEFKRQKEVNVKMIFSGTELKVEDGIVLLTPYVYGDIRKRIFSGQCPKSTAPLTIAVLGPDGVRTAIEGK
jgi:hypothetical protein